MTNGRKVNSSNPQDNYSRSKSVGIKASIKHQNGMNNRSKDDRCILYKFASKWWP